MKTKYIKVAVFPAIVVVMLSLIDAFIFVPLNQQLTLAQQIVHMKEFWLLASGIFLAIAITYFFIVGDKSESFALFWTGLVLVSTGWEDIIFYVARNMPIDLALPWLNSPHPVGIISNLMGFQIVTNISLMLSAIIGLAVLGITIPILIKLESVK